MANWERHGPFSWVPDPEFPLGRRGDRPIRVWVSTDEADRCGLSRVPGYVCTRYGYGRCTWDIVPVAAKLLGVKCPPMPVEPWVAAKLSKLLGEEVEGLTPGQISDELSRMKGVEEYKALKFHAGLRGYQKEDVVFCARRSGSFNCIAMRGGKTRVNLGAAILRGAEKVLIIGLGRTRRGWMREVSKVAHQVSPEQEVMEIAAREYKAEVLALYGRRGNVARQWCIHCTGTGRIPDPIGLTGDMPCPRCKKANGHADGMRLFNVLEGKCRQHAWVGDHKKHECPGCLEEFFGALGAARFVYCNYDLIIGQKETDWAGQERYSTVLRGQVETLQKYKWGMVIVSESHLVSSWTSKPADNRGKSKREKVIQLTPPETVGEIFKVDQVICETGTPGANDISNYWAQWDLMTAGAASGGMKRMPFSYHQAYANGHKGKYGWEWGGQTEEAEWQIPIRHAVLMTERTYAEIFPDLPPETWELVQLEPEDAAASAEDVSMAELAEMAAEPKYDSKLARLSLAAVEAKKSAIVDMILEDMYAGNKVIVYTHYKVPCRRIYSALKREMEKPGVKRRLRNARIWQCDGEVKDDIRDAYCEAYTAHTGPGCLIATYESTNMGVTLGGATHVIMAEWSFKPWAVSQAIRRSYMPPLEKLHVSCTVAIGSIDEHISAKLMAKYRELMKQQASTDKGMIDAMGYVEIDKSALLTTFSTLALGGDPVLGWSDVQDND